MNLTVDGKVVHAATGGRDFDPALPAIVFVHGAGMDHTVWALQARYFAHRGRAVLAVDLPGHGHSAGPALASIEVIADWLAALIAAAGLESAALAGHSMGALAALACAARHPKRVRTLALLGVAPSMPVHPDLLAAAQANDHRAFDLVTDWGHGAAAHLGHHPAPGLWLMGGAEALLERCAPGVLHNDLAACNAYQEAEAAAAKVTCPTLLVLGADDRMTPAKAGQKLAAIIPGAQCVVIPEAGHMMMSEAADATLDALKTIF
jgi:pimeloyl-ACP methyl ester carboxylesterase